MKYLLDINLLIALSHTAHVHHERAKSWYASVKPIQASLCTCPLTELGFVRVSVQIGLQEDVLAAKKALAALKSSSSLPFDIVGDDVGVARLPGFARTPNKLTDGHLLELARKHGIQLATLDSGIPGAILLP